MAFKLNGGVGVIIAVLGAALVAGGVLVKIEIAEAEQEELDSRIDCLENNQWMLDEGQRNLKADSGWAHTKLDILLKAAGHDEQVKRPEVEESKLEKPRH
jgi:outer membrane murein-binding lipoprotein Lpp